MSSAFSLLSVYYLFIFLAYYVSQDFALKYAPVIACRITISGTYPQLRILLIKLILLNMKMTSKGFFGI